MAKRKKNGNKQNADPVQLAQRFIERGDYRQGLKQARVAHRKSPGDETQRLLEQASFGRADELLRSGHVDQSRDLLIPLTRSICDPKLKDTLPDLLLRAGVLDQFPEFRGAVSETDRQDFEIASFDQAVVDPSRARTADIRQLTGLIRDAMEAVEAGDDSGATEFLRGIPRRSLAADWRYFIRGLIAWYGNDRDTVAANWSRLDPARAASRIVAQLTCSTRVDSAAGQDEPSNAGDPFTVRAEATLPASVIKAVPALSSTDGLQRVLLELANENWSAVSDAFQECRSVLRQHAPELFDRVAEKIITRLIRSEDVDAFEKFCRRVEAPPRDPNWNRARASLSEARFYEGDEDLYLAENRWLQALRDIDQIDQFSDAEKQIARALVKTRVGELSIGEIEDLADCSCGASHEDDIAGLRERAIEFLESAIGTYPACTDPWRQLIRLHEILDDDTALRAARTRMLAKLPEDLDTLLDAAESELDGGDPLQRRDYLLRAMRIKPLDERLRALVMVAHRECARTFIRATEFDTARTELAAARAVDNGNELYHVNHLVLEAILEFAAENDLVAEGCIKDALEVYTEPTAVYLDLAIEAAKVDLPQSVIRRFEGAWRKGLKKKCHSQTAGRLAALASPQVDGNPPDCEGYNADVVRYIKRTSHVRYTCMELCSVCVFLQVVDERKLLAKFIKKGCQRFPDEPLFHLLTAESEIRNGAFDCNHKQATDAYTRVLELCDPSTDARHQRIADSARQGLSFLNEMGLGSPQFPTASSDPDAPMSPQVVLAFIESIAEESGLDMSELLKKMEAEANASHS